MPLTGYRIAGMALGYPLGVFGTMCVAVVTMTCVFLTMSTIASPLQPSGAQSSGFMPGGLFIGMLYGGYGGFFVGLLTGGPVFAALAVFRPVALAWCIVFGIACVSSLIGLALDVSYTGGGFPPLLSVALPAVSLLVSAPSYALCTRKNSNFREVYPDGHTLARRSLRSRVGLRRSRDDGPWFCPECGYLAQAHQPRDRCAACGTARG